MDIKPWRHSSQREHGLHRNSRPARVERTFAVQWKHRIFTRFQEGFDMQRPCQLLPIGPQEMPELRVLVQPMFQQHYIYYMAHRYFHESLACDADLDIWSVLKKFTKRYTNPNASEIRFLNQFYPAVSPESLKHMSLADCAVRFLLDSKTWDKPTDSQHFSKACSFANRPKKPLAVANDGTGGLQPLTDQ